tara:strand:- start:178 stop:537 length:360 start_codon:yes stop_codon:yes gene_type:complete
MIFGSQKYWVDPDLVSERLDKLKKEKKLIKFLIQDNVSDEGYWKSDFVPTLFEHYTYTYQMMKFLLDLMLTKRKYNPQAKKKEYILDAKQYDYLRSHTNLLKVLDLELKAKYNLSFTIH